MGNEIYSQFTICFLWYSLVLIFTVGDNQEAVKGGEVAECFKSGEQCAAACGFTLYKIQNNIAADFQMVTLSRSWEQIGLVRP